MLVDANILLFAVDEDSPFHAPAMRWLTDQLNGDRPVGLPWTVLTAFLRISTHARVFANPLSSDEAWRRIVDWLACDVVWTPEPTRRHAELLGTLVVSYRLTGNLVSDAALAALAMEHGLTVCSADTDFARFSELRWENPLA